VRQTSLGDREYERLLAFRVTLRRFLRWSREQALARGLTPAQHQLLLVLRAHPDPRGPTIGELAASLLVRHHSAVQLVDRVQGLGLVRRERDGHDRRVVRVRLTATGAGRIAALSASHVEELRRLASLATIARRTTAAARSHPDHANGGTEGDGRLGGAQLAERAQRRRPPAASARRYTAS
jgi:DNA-binding MarR family transcriptional regulator